MIVNCLYGNYSYTEIVKNIFQKKYEHQDDGTKVYHQEDKKPVQAFQRGCWSTVIGDEA